MVKSLGNTVIDSMAILPVNNNKITSILFISKFSQKLQESELEFGRLKLDRMFSMDLHPIKIYYNTCLFMFKVV